MIESHPDEPESAIEIRDLRKRFGSTKVLDGIDLIVGRGQVFGYVGPNGAGKTTTVRIARGEPRMQRQHRRFGARRRVSREPGRR